MAGIYVHVPFCHSRCAYCDFYSRAGSRHTDEYIGALEREFALRRHELGRHSVETIYFGGGTPSILSPEQFEKLVSVFHEFKAGEFTVEANPEDIEPHRLNSWKKCGVNRISMGVQSLVDSELKAVGRRHSSQQAIAAIDAIRAAGFRNISCDLIYGLPGQTMDSWRYSVDRLLEIRPEHLSAYCLTIEPNTALGVRLRRGEFIEADDDLTAAFYGYLCSAARKAGYSHYEISNFALPGFHSRHNSSYWDSTPYLGLGPGAHSLGADGLRRYVESNLKLYLAEPAECLHTDPETETEKANDIIFTALRTAKGLDTALFPAKYLSVLEANARPLIENGSLCKDGRRIYISEDRWLTSDAIIRELLI